LDDYKFKTDYLTAHFSKMWTRFNFFLRIETGLMGVAFLASRDQWSRCAVVFALAGVLVSLAWYVFGAQDRYLVLLYRDQVNCLLEESLRDLKAILGAGGLPGSILRSSPRRRYGRKSGGNKQESLSVALWVHERYQAGCDSPGCGSFAVGTHYFAAMHRITKMTHQSEPIGC
jgi:hypothetical protein